jgi:hypothetical protein
VWVTSPLRDALLLLIGTVAGGAGPFATSRRPAPLARWRQNEAPRSDRHNAVARVFVDVGRVVIHQLAGAGELGPSRDQITMARRCDNCPKTAASVDDAGASTHALAAHAGAFWRRCSKRRSGCGTTRRRAGGTTATAPAPARAGRPSPQRAQQQRLIPPGWDKPAHMARAEGRPRRDAHRRRPSPSTRSAPPRRRRRPRCLWTRTPR